MQTPLEMTQAVPVISPSIIDAGAPCQVQRRVRRNKGVEVSRHPIQAPTADACEKLGCEVVIWARHKQPFFQHKHSTFYCFLPSKVTVKLGVA